MGHMASSFPRKEHRTGKLGLIGDSVEGWIILAHYTNFSFVFAFSS